MEKKWRETLLLACQVQGMGEIKHGLKVLFQGDKEE